jgi:hypothetical protein
MGLQEGDGLAVCWGRVGWNEPCHAADTWSEVISRAVAPPEQWVKEAARLVAPGGRLWVMSGSPHAEAVEQPGEGGASAPGGWELAPGFRLEEIAPYRLPFCGLERQLVSLRRSLADHEAL